MNTNYIKNWKGNLFKMKFHCAKVCIYLLSKIFIYLRASQRGEGWQRAKRIPAEPDPSGDSSGDQTLRPLSQPGALLRLSFSQVHDRSCVDLGLCSFTQLPCGPVP